MSSRRDPAGGEKGHSWVARSERNARSTGTLSFIPRSILSNAQQKPPKAGKCFKAMGSMASDVKESAMNRET